MGSSRLLAATLLLAGFSTSGCCGLPDGYGDALRNAEGPAALSCSTSTDPSIVGVLGIKNPGERLMEIRSVEFADASPARVEFYVMEVPMGSNVINGIGSTALADGFDDSPPSATAWRNRQTVPAEVRPGHDAEIVVVLDKPGDPTAVNYVNEIEVTVAVGKDTETARFASLRIAGTEAGCEATAIELEGDG